MVMCTAPDARPAEGQVDETSVSWEYSCCHIQVQRDSSRPSSHCTLSRHTYTMTLTLTATHPTGAKAIYMVTAQPRGRSHICTHVCTHTLCKDVYEATACAMTQLHRHSL